MTTMEKFALVILGIEVIGAAVISRAATKEANKMASEKFGCKNVWEFLERVDNGEIKFEKR